MESFTLPLKIPEPQNCSSLSKNSFFIKYIKFFKISWYINCSSTQTRGSFMSISSNMLISGNKYNTYQSNPNQKQSDEKVAEQNGPVDGLNLEVLCKEEDNKHLILPIGKGNYDLGELLNKATCPDCEKHLKEIEKIFFKNCTYSIEAHKKNKEILNVLNEKVTELKIDVSDFLKANITTK